MSTSWSTRAKLALLTVVGALAVAAPAAAAPGECPAILPTASVTKGMVGEGWTVSEGTTPERFDIEVLGVLPNAVGPGRDMIIVDTTSPAIDAVGGIWFGMSGSPVYVDGKLIGAVAFGLSFGPSKIAGLTPASELLTVHGYPTAALTSARAKVRVPPALARTIARRTGRALAASATFSPLKMPVSVSGVDSRGLKRVNTLAKQRGTSIVAYRGASAAAVPAADPAEIVPGGNFAAALSYGDVTVGGVGTTSYVCDDRAVAFGHRAFLFGKTSMAASAADALAIVGDSIGGPFKLATIGGTVGILDQDRIGGVRALLGTTPSTIPIESNLTSLDTNRSRLGQTDAVLEDVLPDLGFLHVLSNIDSVQDAVGPGSARLGWTITGTDGGDPWMLQRQDVFASEFDLAFEASVEFANELAAIGSFRRDGVHVEGMTFGGWVEQPVKSLEIIRVLVRRNGVYRPLGEELTAFPGQLLRFRIVLKPAAGGPNQLRHLELRMPDRFRFGLIEVAGGPAEEFCGEEECEGPATFEALLDQLENKRRHDVLSARLLVGEALTQRAIATRRLDQFVQGQRTVFVSRPGEGGP